MEVAGIRPFLTNFPCNLQLLIMIISYNQQLHLVARMQRGFFFLNISIRKMAHYGLQMELKITGNIHIRQDMGTIHYRWVNLCDIHLVFCFILANFYFFFFTICFSSAPSSGHSAEFSLKTSIQDTFTYFMPRPTFSFQRCRSLNENYPVMQQCTCL